MTNPFTPKQIEAARDVIIAAESWTEEHGVDVALRVARAALQAAKAAETPASVECDAAMKLVPTEPSEHTLNKIATMLNVKDIEKYTYGQRLDWADSIYYVVLESATATLSHPHTKGK